MIVQFKNDDKGYLNWIRDNPNGYVYNDFGGADVTYKKLHRADCKLLHNIPPRWKKTSYRKICCSNFYELVNWLKENRGPQDTGFSFCMACEPSPTNSTI